jgi:hypothetical protein
MTENITLPVDLEHVVPPKLTDGGGSLGSTNVKKRNNKEAQ